MTTSFTEAVHDGEFLISELPGYQSRTAITVASGQNLAAGTVMGQQTLNTTVANPSVVGTGNGTMAMDGTTPLLAGAQVGNYVVTCTTAVSGGGEFTVVAPNGEDLGLVKCGATFANQVKFVITAGGTAFVTGDSFTIVVGTGNGKYYAQAPSAYDGTAIPVGLLYAAVNATSADTAGTLVARGAEVDGGLVGYFSTNVTTLTNTQLAALNPPILVR